MGYFFAHVMGTIEGGIESLPGTEGNADFNRGTELNSYQRTARGNVAVVFKDDPSTEPLRAFLLATVRSCQELYSAARRLGLPETSVRNKLPWYRDAMVDPHKAVVLSLHQRAMLAGLSSGALASEDVNYRPKPHFRTGPPGIKTVIAANVLLVWLVCTVRI
ncbi:hypothetical protein COCOBI_09-3180 [Coccomyxa sp. Obi]|nr:hypothetical protein COCOBI_09-3180 [Coccomyxa sp. Obi]